MTSLLAVVATGAAAAGADVRICLGETASDLAASLSDTAGIMAVTGSGTAAALIKATAADAMRRNAGRASCETTAHWQPVVLIIDDFQHLAFTACTRHHAAGKHGLPPVLMAVEYMAACSRSASATLVVGTHGMARVTALIPDMRIRAGLGPLPRYVRITLVGTAAAGRRRHRGPGAGFVTDGITWTRFQAARCQPRPSTATSPDTGEN